MTALPRSLVTRSPTLATTCRNLALATACLAVVACTSPRPLSPDGTVHPRSLALVCVNAQGEPIEMDQCEADSRVRALVGGGSRGTVSIGNPSAGNWFDTDLSVPGFTGLRLEDLPGVLAVDAAHRHAFVGLETIGQVVRLDISGLNKGQIQVVDSVALGFSPAALLVAGTAPALYAADPIGGKLIRIPLAEFGAAAVPQVLDVGGSPVSLAWTPGHLWIGHLRHRHVTVITPDRPGPPVRISLAEACANGLDDDGDGATDAADSGCDDPRDKVEGNPETGLPACSNRQDDDGDGRADSADPGCAATPTLVDVCRNGIDDDGDGQTDFPDDPGCNGFGDTGEWSDNPSCSDGFDNDGDGKTDAADAKCAGGPGGAEAPAPAGAAAGACGNGVDDDGDGQTDFPADPDCPYAASGNEARRPCADGLDNDGDGLVDLADPDCYNRLTPSEVGALPQPDARVAATFGGQYVVVADRGRRVLLVLDAATRQLIAPVAGQSTPFANAARLDARDGLRGVATPHLPLALAPVTFDGRDAMAVGLAGGGLQILRFELEPSGARAIGLVPADAEDTTEIGRPQFFLDSVQQELLKSRYASFGLPLTKVTTGATTTFYGLTPTAELAEHRSELWRFEHEGLLPGAEGSQGRFLQPDVLHDPAVDFCQVGVLPGDLLIVRRTGQACGGIEPGAVQYRVATVAADRLTLEPTSGRRDVPVTEDSQLEFDPSQVPTVPLPAPGCFAESGVRYEVRARDWLVSGSRTGVLSQRRSLDGHCLPLSASELSGARVHEPQVKADATPAACPVVAAPLDAALTPSPVEHPAFTGQLVPGCVLQVDDDGTSRVRLVPSIRGATWTFGLTSGLQPRASAVGGAPGAVQSGPKLVRAYVVDEASGTLAVVDLATGEVPTALE